MMRCPQQVRLPATYTFHISEEKRVLAQLLEVCLHVMREAGMFDLLDMVEPLPNEDSTRVLKTTC